MQGRSRESTRDPLFGEIALVRKLGVWYNHDMKIVKVLFPLVALCCWTAVSAAEKTMRILRSATTTNDTWVAAIGGLDEGDTLVFDTSDFTAVGGGSAVNLLRRYRG